MRHITAWLLAVLFVFTSVAGIASAQTTSCERLSYSMYRGISDYQVRGDVSRLQNFLAGEGLLSYQNISGYYGSLTEHAVKRFQAGRGILSYGTPYTTGFGVVGRTTRGVINTLCGGTVVTPRCVTVSIPSCTYGSPTPTYNSQGCITSYTCSSVVGSGSAPVLTNFSGPTRLRVGETGTWSINAIDPEGGSLSYSLAWGDVSNALTAATTQVNQYSTFTHNYSQTGTYSVVITVRDQQGLSATATTTVVVDYSNTTSNDIRVLSPNTYTNYNIGNQMSIQWQDLITTIQTSAYEVRLVSYSSACTQTQCPLNPNYTYTVATNFFGTSYNWLIPSSIPTGSYQIQVCRSGTLVCDVSDAQFYISGNGSGTGVTMSLSPITGAVPLTTTATIVINNSSSLSSTCGTSTYGYLDWGDGSNEAVSYLGCTTYQTINRSHTYNNAGTYQVRLTDVSGNLVTTSSVTANTTGNYITSASVDKSTVNRGEQLTVSWTTASTWSDARIRLELREVNGNSVGESGIVTGLSAQSGTYVWTVPTDTTGGCVADAGVLCSSQIVPGRQYIVRVIAYTPSNYCWGYCQAVSGSQILSTRDTASFTIGNTSGTGYISSLDINRTSVNRGEAMNVSWVVPTTRSDARIRLELREVNGASVGGNGIVTGLSAQTGNYSWTVPTDTSSSCPSDSASLCSSQIVAGRQYIIRAIMYTPSNYCWGYCTSVSGSQILATRDSIPFTIGTSGTGTGSFTALLTATTDGYPGYPYMINISARTPTYGTQCTIPSSLTLDYGDGQTVNIATPSSGTSTCGYQYNTYTHYYSSPGTYTLMIKNTVYPYEVVTSQSLYVN